MAYHMTSIITIYKIGKELGGTEIRRIYPVSQSIWTLIYIHHYITLKMFNII
jgi:hypothetical protein